MEKLVPKLRFPGIEDIEYKNYSFEDIFLFSTGKNIKFNEASTKYETPCVRYGELYHMYNEVIYEVINKTNLDKSELIFSEGNEILLPSAGEDPLDIGSASALTVKNVAIGRTINILKPKDQDIYSPIYVSYYINKKLKKKIASLAKGVSISNVYNSDLKTLKIKLPSLKEQQKIASFLTSVDERITLLEKQKQGLETYKKGVMQQLFSQQLRFKDDEGKDFPDWEEKKLGELLKHLSLRNKKIEIENVLSVSNTKGFISQNEQFENHRVASKDVSNYKIVKKNQFAYNPSRINVGSIAKLKNFEIGIVSPMYVVFETSKKLDHTFFESLIDLHYFKFLVKKGCSGSVRDSLNFEDLEQFNFKIPSIKEQQKIASFLSAIDERIAVVSKQIEQSKVFKKGLLQQLFV